ncbi:MAG: hypothetical protein DDG60_10995 [Anaerolineae bacterium]|nr:MAG: hypothetical protein DDG60_10995 [Anaerolineae bacterium]
MKTYSYLPIPVLLTTALLIACNMPNAEQVNQVPSPTATAAATAAATSVPTSQPAILTVAEETGCFYGPGSNYDQMTLLAPGQTFEITGIDDDIAWIDDDIAWFQVDPTAIIDPDPPDRPPNETAGAGMTVRCWVPSDKVETEGDLTQVPIIQVPVLRVAQAIGCYQTPEVLSGIVVNLDVGLWFRILAIDDDIAWIDDDIAWYQVDPTAVVDPEPPHRPLDELSPQPDPPGAQTRLRCWVPGDKVETEGDLFVLPIGFHHPGLRVLTNANCRSGPTRDYPVRSFVTAGSQYAIRARNSHGDAWMIFDPAINGTCWIYGGLAEVFGDTDLVMIIDPEPPDLTMPEATKMPKPQPVTDCSQYNTNPAACNANPACYWDASVPPNGVCKNK